MEEKAVRKKRPFGFYVCSITFSFERAAYYASKFLIVFFVAATVAEGGLGLDKVQGGLMQSNLVAFTYLAPIFGGIISDRWIGARYTVPLGMFIMGIGYIVCSQATGLGGVYAMVALVSIGTGLFKGNVSALNGTLFDDKDELDSAFSLQYSFVNIGAFIGTFAVGILYAKTFAHDGVLGFSQCFMLAGILCILGGIWFILGSRYLGDKGKKPFKAGIAKEEKVAKVEENRPMTTSEKKKVGAIILVSLFSVIFWMFWYLTYLAVYDYGDQFVNLFVGNFEVPLSWFDTLNSACCIILGPVLGIVWYRLAQRPQGDMSLFKKLAIGLSLLGASFLMLVGAEISRGVGAPETSKASIMWIVMFGILLSLGEMFFSPLGNSFVSKYAPKKILSVLMGVWTFATFIAGKIYGNVYEFTSQYPIMVAYIAIPVILFIAAVLLFVFDKKLSSLLDGDDGATA